MKLYKLNEFTKGWIVGDFDPSIIRTKEAEISIREYKKGDRDEIHIHKLADEITVIVSGKFKYNGKVLKKNDIALIVRHEQADFECLEDGVNVVIKVPSVVGDKHVIGVKS